MGNMKNDVEITDVSFVVIRIFCSYELNTTMLKFILWKHVRDGRSAKDD